MEDLIKKYAEGERIFYRRREIFLPSLTQQNGNLIILPLLFYLQLELCCRKLHHFVEYTRRKCFKSFAQSTVVEGRQNDGNPNSCRVRETLKLLPNSFYGYQNMDRSRHSMTEYLNEQCTHVGNSSILFKKLDNLKNPLKEFELVKASIEHKKNNHCRLLYSSICKTANVGTLLQLFQQFLWRKQARIIGNVYRFSLPCSCQKGTGKMFLTRNESRVRTVAIKRQRQWFHYRPNQKFRPSNVLCQSQETWRVRARTLERRVQTHRDVMFMQQDVLLLWCYKITFSSKSLKKRVPERSGDGPSKIFLWYSGRKCEYYVNQHRFPLQTITLLLHMNSLKKDSSIFIQKEL